MIQVVRGCLSKQIAHDIGIAEATVKVHRMRAMQKMTDVLSRVRPAGRQAQAAARNAATLVSTTPCATRCSRGGSADPP
jgi:FixJ family two-component response regulator